MLVVKMGQDGHDRGAKVIATRPRKRPRRTPSTTMSMSSASRQMTWFVDACQTGAGAQGSGRGRDPGDLRRCHPAAGPRPSLARSGSQPSMPRHQHLRRRRDPRSVRKSDESRVAVTQCPRSRGFWCSARRVIVPCSPDCLFLTQAFPEGPPVMTDSVRTIPPCRRRSTSPAPHPGNALRSGPETARQWPRCCPCGSPAWPRRSTRSRPIPGCHCHRR